MIEWTPHLTQDGSFTFFSEAFNEAFHSKQGAWREAIEKFALTTHLPQLATSSSPIKLLDICYGLGLNTAAALETIWQINPHCQVELYALDIDISVARAAIDLQASDEIAHSSVLPCSNSVRAVLSSLAQNLTAVPPSLTTCLPIAPIIAHLLIGDARQTIAQVQRAGFQADAIFFDPFSPRRCPQLWTVEFFQQVAQCLAPQGRLATYSRSASVRSAMLQAGFIIGTLPLTQPDPNHPHEWAQGTIAVLPGNTTELIPLSPMEQEHLQTRAGVPLRDPDLSDDAATILARQQQEQQSSDRPSTSSWRRHWGMG